MTTVIYPGSFDPITNGHLDIATRAARLFERVVIGIYEVPEKQLFFTTEERIDLAKRAVANLPNVEVEAFSGLVVDFAIPHSLFLYKKPAFAFFLIES